MCDITSASGRPYYFCFVTFTTQDVSLQWNEIRNISNKYFPPFLVYCVEDTNMLTSDTSETLCTLCKFHSCVHTLSHAFCTSPLIISTFLYLLPPIDSEPINKIKPDHVMTVHAIIWWNKTLFKLIVVWLKVLHPILLTSNVFILDNIIHYTVWCELWLRF